MEITDKIAKSVSLIPKIIDVAKKIDTAIKYDLRISHNEYCENIIRKYCKVRTFFVRDEPQYLDEFYVPASIERQGAKRNKVKKAGIEELSSISKKIIVTGTGGSGKTIFMRHLLLNSIEKGFGYPVFIELRNLNNKSEINLESEIFEFMKIHGFPLGNDFSERSLKDGLLVVLLDGFDELSPDKRNAVELSIKNFSANCKSQIVISSRPDMALEGWDGFGKVNLSPLELDEACELVQKINFSVDLDVKSGFIENLKKSLFSSHRYFLSNPLLLSIMLLTYGDSANIPEKFASFYEQAYAALFQKHDALKSGYQRYKKTKLDIYEFSRLFSAFCAITYEKRQFKFSEADAIEYMNIAKIISGSDTVNSSDFIADSKQAVCLLIDEGLDLAFVHRSFQEYFVAKFLSTCNDSLKNTYINRIHDDMSIAINSDGVMKLLFEISPETVEHHYLIPSLNKIYKGKKSKQVSISAWISIFRKIFVSIRRKEGGMNYMVNNSRDFYALSFISENILEKKHFAPKKFPQEIMDILPLELDVALSEIPDDSFFWEFMSTHPSRFPLEKIEAIRLKLMEMEKKVKERALAVESIFFT